MFLVKLIILYENKKMKLTLFILISLLIAFVLYLFILGLNSKSGTAAGLIESKLSRCPDTPNCISSEYPEQQAHYISPIKIALDRKINISPLSVLEDIVQEIGGIVEDQNGNYLAATFTSSIFRFVDDVEIRIDKENNVIHLRSASRVGRSDMGANLKRLKLLKKIYKNKTSS